MKPFNPAPEDPIGRRLQASTAQPTQRGPRVNEDIRVPRVTLVDEEGTRLGEFLTADALELARTRGLDLVEVAAEARPPVCRITDHGKLKFERQKKATAARRNQRSVGLKQIKIRPKTDDHDMDVRIRRALDFLSKGHTVKVNVWFRGREHAHHEIGEQQCMVIADAVKEIGRIDQPPRMEGRNMAMVLLPIAPKS